MKKLLVLLAALLLVTSLTGCSGGKEQSGDEPSVITIDMSTLFIVPNLEATQTVEDSINDYLKNELGETGYKIHLKITSIGDYLQKIPMELASGGDDTADIVQVFDVANWADNGYIIPLDQYADNELKPTIDMIGDVLNNGKVDGQIFMIPRFFGTVLDWKWIYNKAYVESDEAKAAGVDPANVKDLDTLGEEMAKLKTVYPDEYFLVYCDQFNRIYNSKTKTSQVGTYTATVGDSTTLYNYYETDAFKNAIYKAYEFRQKGYADPEGSANTLSHDAVVMGGASKGVIMGHSNDCDSIAYMFSTTNTYGAEFGAVTIALDDKATDTLGIGISHSCKDPAAAARFINLLYTDQFVWDALIYGAEGQDYVWNEDHTMIRYPDGMDFNTVPYNCMYSCGMIGNGFDYFLTYESGNETGSNGEYGKILFEKAATPPLYGFIPSTTNVANEIAAVSNVVDQYSNVLMYGDVNPDEQYPVFLQALKDAGIDKIVADYQTQADAWVKANK
ncbi:MAG: ABC transporter substrate-binding protein [Erysipelotrichaceae bacterium]|nr:ABC transporter substrate-binding protein [Erysipelotrichaceae bacterium]